MQTIDWNDLRWFRSGIPEADAFPLRWGETPPDQEEAAVRLRANIPVTRGEDKLRINVQAPDDDIVSVGVSAYVTLPQFNYSMIELYADDGTRVAKSPWSPGPLVQVSVGTPPNMEPGDLPEHDLPAWDHPDVAVPQGFSGYYIITRAKGIDNYAFAYSSTGPLDGDYTGVGGDGFETQKAVETWADGSVFEVTRRRIDE